MKNRKRGKGFNLLVISSVSNFICFHRNMFTFQENAEDEKGEEKIATDDVVREALFSDFLISTECSITEDVDEFTSIIYIIIKNNIQSQKGFESKTELLRMQCCVNLLVENLVRMQ